MKILMINKFLYHCGGSETYMFKLGDFLTQRGHKVQYFGMYDDRNQVGNELEEYTANMDFHKGPIFSKLSYPIKTIYSRDARVKIRKILKEFKPDVCHINNFNYQLTPSILLEIQKWRENDNKCRLVYTAHDYQLICPNHMCYNPVNGQNCEKCLGGNFFCCLKGKCIHNSSIKSLIGSLEAEFWKLNGVYRNIDTIVCCSEFMKRKTDSNILFQKKTVKIHNFIDNVKWENIQKKNYVLYFGRYSKEKGIDLLTNVCKELSDVNFIFAGSGPLENEINEISNINNVGFQSGENLKRLISEALFSVYPSIWYENCPFSVMESQMYGTPVIGADIGGIPELIEIGKTGELFKSNDSSDLKRMIMKLWNDKALAIAYSRNCKNLSFNTIEDYYNKIMRIYTGKGV